MSLKRESFEIFIVIFIVYRGAREQTAPNAVVTVSLYVHHLRSAKIRLYIYIYITFTRLIITKPTECRARIYITRNR